MSSLPLCNLFSLSILSLCLEVNCFFFPFPPSFINVDNVEMIFLWFFAMFYFLSPAMHMYHLCHHVIYFFLHSYLMSRSLLDFLFLSSLFFFTITMSKSLLFYHLNLVFFFLKNNHHHHHQLSPPLSPFFFAIQNGVGWVVGWDWYWFADQFLNFWSFSPLFFSDLFFCFWRVESRAFLELGTARCWNWERGKATVKEMGRVWRSR